MPFAMSRRTCVLLRCVHVLPLAALIVAAGSTGRAATCVDYETYFREVDSASLFWGFSAPLAGGAVRSGNYLYVADQAGQLQVVDVSVPDSPSAGFPVSVTGNPIDVDADGAVACVAAQNPSALYVYDLSNPAAPSPMGSTSMSGFPEAISMEGDLVVAVAFSTFSVYDVSNPSAPTPVGTLGLPEYVFDVDVVGSRAYVVGSDLHVVDLADPVHPALLSTTDTGVTTGSSGAIRVDGTNAYMVIGSGGFLVADVTDPYAPSILSRSLDFTHFDGVDVDGTVAYTSELGTGTTTWDVTDPNAPVELGRAPYGSRTLVASGGWVWVTPSTDVYALDASNPASPAVTGATAGLGVPAHLTTSGGYAYVVDDVTGLRVVDIGDPDLPIIVGSWTSSGVEGVAVSGSVAATVTPSFPNTLVSFVDVSVPESPSLLGTSSLPGTARNVVTGGDLAYVCGTGGVQIVDFTNPSSPVSRGALTFGTGTNVQDLVLVGDLLYGMNGGGTELYVIDVADPDNPVESGRTTNWFPASPFPCEEIAGNATNAFVARGATLAAFDVTDPAAPSPVGLAVLPAVSHGLSLDGDLVYVAIDYGVVVVDVSDPANPTVLGGAPTPGQAQAVDVSGGNVFAACAAGAGLVGLPGHCGAAVTGVTPSPVTGSLSLSPPAPNPFRGDAVLELTLDRTRFARLALYDVAGRRVRELASGVLTAGPHAFRWDGRNAAGEPVVRGVYFARLECGSEVRATRVVFLGR